MRSKRAEKDPSAAERLAEWLRCWRLHQALRPDESTAGAPSRGPVSETLELAAVHVGEVRLLKPTTATAERRAWFVAVLDRAGQDGWFVAPFSALPLAAFEGELQLGVRRPPYLRTLCAWNARRISDRALTYGSWPCGRLTAAHLRAARAVWAAWRMAASLPRSLRLRVGPTLAHPRDPRRAYEAEEAAAFDHTVVSLEESSAEAMEPSGLSYLIPDTERLWAAESEDDRGPPGGRPHR